MPETPAARQLPHRKWLAWAGLVLVLILAAIVSAFFYLHW
jgi:hypothetical protein